MIYRAFYRIAYDLVMAMPLRVFGWQNPVTWWLLPYAGEWAYRGGQD